MRHKPVQTVICVWVAKMVYKNHVGNYNESDKIWHVLVW